MLKEIDKLARHPTDNSDDNFGHDGRGLRPDRLLDFGLVTDDMYLATWRTDNPDDDDDISPRKVVGLTNNCASVLYSRRPTDNSAAAANAPHKWRRTAKSCRRPTANFRQIGAYFRIWAL